MPDPTPTVQHRVRNWCLGTVMGAVLISIASDQISATIPNPLSYIIRWFKGEKEAEEAATPKAQIDVHLPDTKTPLKGSAVTVHTGRKYPHGAAMHENGIAIPFVFTNSGNAETGALQLITYFDSHFPRPFGCLDAKVSDYAYELYSTLVFDQPTGSAVTFAGSGSSLNMIPKMTMPVWLGLVFDKPDTKPSPGIYRSKLVVKNFLGTELYQGEFRFEVPQNSAVQPSGKNTGTEK